MPNELAKKIMGHNLTFKNLQITNDEKDFNFEKNQAALATNIIERSNKMASK